MMGNQLFMKDNFGCFPHVQRNPHWPAPPDTYPPYTQNGDWWPAFLAPYLPKETRVFQCPLVKQDGIGMNHPAIGRVNQRRGLSFDLVRDPSATIALADAAVIVNPTEINPDFWLPVDPRVGAPYFRTPDNMPWYVNAPARMIGRHRGKLTAAFADGHVTPMPIRETGIEKPLGDPAALWDNP